MPDIGWLLFAYIAGTAIGWYFSYSSRVQSIAEDLVEKLVEDGYIKTKGTGDKMELLKHWEKE